MGLSRRIAAWLSHLYPGRAAGQTQDCDCEPGQGENREVWGTSGDGAESALLAGGAICASICLHRQQILLDLFHR